MKIYTSLLIVLSIIFSACNNSSDIGSNNDCTPEGSGSLWPKTKPIDECMVITKLDNDSLDYFIIPARPDLVKFESAYNDVELGRSVSSATGNVLGDLVKYEGKPEEVRIKPIGHIEYDFKSVSDIYDLVKKFHLDISASVKYFNFQGNAKYETEKQLSINRYHEYVVARVYDEDHEETLKEKKLLPEAAELGRKDKKKFVSKYGNEIITSKVMGGDLFAVFEIESTNSTEHESNKVHIDAALKGFSFSAKAEANLQQSLDELSKCTSTTIKLISNGVVTTDKVSYTNIANLKSLIDTFPRVIQRGGRALEYKKSSIFSAVQDLPTNLSASDFLPIISQGAKLNILEDHINVILMNQADLRFIGESRNLFINTSVDSARKIYNRNYKAMSVYTYNWQVCASAPELCDKCLEFKYKIPDYKPTLNPAPQNTAPTKTNVTLPISSNYTTIANIPSKQMASVDFVGKVQYNHIGPLDCREPALNAKDFNIQISKLYGVGIQVPRLMPVIEVQYFEKLNDGSEVPSGSSFFWTGNTIDILQSIKNRILKARFNLFWMQDFGKGPQISNIAVDQKEMHIQEHIQNCDGGTIHAVVTQ